MTSSFWFAPLRPITLLLTAGPRQTQGGPERTLPMSQRGGPTAPPRTRSVIPHHTAPHRPGCQLCVCVHRPQHVRRRAKPATYLLGGSALNSASRPAPSHPRQQRNAAPERRPQQPPNSPALSPRTAIHTTTHVMSRTIGAGRTS